MLGAISVCVGSLHYIRFIEIMASGNPVPIGTMVATHRDTSGHLKYFAALFGRPIAARSADRFDRFLYVHRAFAFDGCRVDNAAYCVVDDIGSPACVPPSDRYTPASKFVIDNSNCPGVAGLCNLGV